MKIFSFIPFSRVLHTFCTLTLLTLSGCTQKEQKTTIAVVVPVEHTALREIVDGFESTIQNETKGDFNVVVKNAYGEASMQKTILQQLIAQKVDLIVPIGLGATQMSAHMTRDIPIVSLAAKIDPSEKPSNLTGVNDELEVHQVLSFAKIAVPSLNKLTLIHSASEKIFPEVETLKQLCKQQNLELQTLMVHNVNDIYPVAKSIDRQSQLILILKDHTVVSGVATLCQQAEKLQIPLMASDEGSVREGACFALGVCERDIGVEGAKLAIRVMNGENPENLNIQSLSCLQVFINKKSCESLGLLPKKIEDLALLQHIESICVE